MPLPRVLLLALALFLGGSGAAAAQADDGTFHTELYSFSDELGGFLIRSVVGLGTRDDPITIHQEFLSASPVTMVIRAVGQLRPFMAGSTPAHGFTHIRIVTHNNSGQAWVEFEFELQERLGMASRFGDGLSFDQRRTVTENISSDSFARYSRDFEPYDRLLFRDGNVDPGETAGFSFLVTDFTPRLEFYLVQDPRIPSS